MKSKKIYIEDLKDTDDYLRYRRIIKRLAEETDLIKTAEEIGRLHSGRKSRSLFGSELSADKIIEANLQDTSYRSRLVEIRIDLAKILSLATTTLDTVKSKVYQTYTEDLKVFKTKGERMSYVESFLTLGTMFTKRVEDLSDQLDLVIKDIDQTSFTYKNAIQILEIIYSKNNDRKI